MAEATSAIQISSGRARKRIVEPTEYSVVSTQPDTAMLTLTSCEPRYSARKRIVVTADLDTSGSDPVEAPVVNYGLDVELPTGIDQGTPDGLATDDATATTVAGDEPAAAADEPTVKGQTQAILKKIDGLLAAAGTSKARLLSTTIYLADIATFDEMNAVWDAWVDPANTPARATVQAKLAQPKYLVEIAVIAGL